MPIGKYIVYIILCSLISGETGVVSHICDYVIGILELLATLSHRCQLKLVVKTFIFREKARQCARLCACAAYGALPGAPAAHAVIHAASSRRSLWGDHTGLPLQLAAAIGINGLNSDPLSC